MLRLRCGRRRRRRLAVGGRRIAVDDVLDFLDRRAARRRIGVVDGDEAERAGAAGLQFDIGDLGAARDRHRRRAAASSELGLAAGPHPPRQRHRRQETAARRMAVGADLCGRHDRQHVAPVHRHGAASPAFGSPGSRNSVARMPLHRARGDDVGRPPRPCRSTCADDRDRALRSHS